MSMEGQQCTCFRLVSVRVSACQKVSEGMEELLKQQSVSTVLSLSTRQPRADVSDSCGKSVCTLHGL